MRATPHSSIKKTSVDERNPYESPRQHDGACTNSSRQTAAATPVANGPKPAVSTANTVLPRHIAAILDNVLAVMLGVAVAKSIPEDLLALQVFLFGAVYLSYYFLFEAFISRTPGKLQTGLIVIKFDGGRCTWRDSLIRTCCRIIEVNPALLGAIPAALSIVLSKHHQRLGDKIARTIVVPSRRIRKQR